MNTLLALSDAAWAALQARLTALADGAAGGALLSVTLDLGAGERDWLQRQPLTREFCYWARPAAGIYRLGLGRAVVCTSAGPARFTALQAAHAGIAGDWRHDGDGCGSSAHAPVACLGFAFEENASGDLPNAQLGVAAVLLTCVGGRASVTFTTAARDRAGAVDRWRKLLAATPPAALPGGGPLPATALAERAWRARVQRALAAIAAGELDKVVLSRSLRLPLAGRVAPVALLARLVERHPESTVFAVGGESAVFLGATPEQLVGFAGSEVRADALAGTAWDDEPLEVDKNAHEQALVVTAIRDALAPLCATLQLPPAPRVLELRGLRKLRHLWTPIAGQVRPGIGLFDLIACLHPTPAVGGWPGAAARDWLRRHGEQRPGWYGGGIGWIDRAGDGEVAVALRCGLLTGRHIELSAGAGIVAGSRAEHEFRETEAKLGTMLGALRADADQARTGTC